MRATTTVIVLACLVSLTTASPAQQPQITSMIVPVVAVDNPQQLVSLNVVDPAGNPIGDVVNVKTGLDGKPSRVMVMLSFGQGLGRVATIRAERLSFDRRDLKLVGQFSAAELTQMAETASTPNGISINRSSSTERPNGVGYSTFGATGSHPGPNSN